MLLQVAIDRAEDFAVFPFLRDAADIIEIGTPVLKRFGVSAITTARELCPGLPVMADSKTADAGGMEARMLFGSGASMITVLSLASRSTIEAAIRAAHELGGQIVVDTILQAESGSHMSDDFSTPEGVDYIALHMPTDARLAGNTSTSHIDSVGAMRERGYRVSLAGGIGPDNLQMAIKARPEILVVGGAITQVDNPGEMAKWIRAEIRKTNHG